MEHMDSRFSILQMEDIYVIHGIVGSNARSQKGQEQLGLNLWQRRRLGLL